MTDKPTRKNTLLPRSVCTSRVPTGCSQPSQGHRVDLALAHLCPGCSRALLLPGQGQSHSCSLESCGVGAPSTVTTRRLGILSTRSPHLCLAAVEAEGAEWLSCPLDHCGSLGHQLCQAEPATVPPGGRPPPRAVTGLSLPSSPQGKDPLLHQPHFTEAGDRRGLGVQARSTPHTTSTRGLSSGLRPAGLPSNDT